MVETFRGQHNEFFQSGPDVDYDVETWYCCRPWPVVVATTTRPQDPEKWPKREAWWVRNCGFCGNMPRPQERG